MLLVFHRTYSGWEGGGRTLNRTLGFKNISLQNFSGMFEFCSFLDFECIKKCYEDFFVELIRERTELLKKTPELPTKNSTNFRNFKNPVFFRIVIFAKLYLRRALLLLRDYVEKILIFFPIWRGDV